MGSIPQTCLVYDYMWSGTNRALQAYPSQSHEFGCALHHLLHAIVDVDLRHGQVHMAKIDLANAYMCTWLRLQDLPKLAFYHPAPSK